MSDKYEVPPPPSADNYKVEFIYKASGLPYCNEQGQGTVTCTECDEVIHNLYTPEEVKDYKYLAGKTQRHNGQKHTNLVYVLTSLGWVQARFLIPDPVKTINDAIDKDMKTRPARVNINPC